MDGDVMKKMFFIVVSLMLFIPVIIAKNDFEIDTSKLEITAKGKALIDGLDKVYKIDTDGFINTEVINQEAKDYTKKLIKIIFNDETTRARKLHEEQFISNNNGFDTLSSLVFIDMFIKDLKDLDIKYDYVKLIRTVEFSGGVITLSYFPNATINGTKEDFILALYLKSDDKGFKLFYPWFTKGKDLEEYFNNLGNREDNGEKIGGTYKSLSIEEGSSNEVSTDQLNKLFNDNKSMNVSISALEDASTNVYGSGFFIRKGLVVTSWSLLLEMLNNSDFLYVNDINKNSYNIEGIVAADTDYDLVVLKLKDEVGQEVNFASDNLKTDDFVFTINSKNNSNFMINYGKNITNYNGKYKNLLALSNSDVGGALYNIEGEVVAFNTNNSLNNDVSIANSTNYIKDLQNILLNEDFNNIKSVSFNDFKDRYYNSYTEEVVLNSVPKREWDKFRRIGNIEKNIVLDLLKASYVDNILSLRYKNKANKSINTFFLSANYENQLLKDGYELTYDNYLKKVYTKDKSNIIIKQYLDYLIVIMMES